MSDLSTEPVNLPDLVEEVDEDMVSVVFESFLEDSNGILDALQSALDSGQADLLRKTAHKVKGCCTTIRAYTAAALAKKIEHAADKGTLDGADVLIKEFAQEYERVREFVMKHLA